MGEKKDPQEKIRREPAACLLKTPPTVGWKSTNFIEKTAFQKYPVIFRQFGFASSFYPLWKGFWADAWSKISCQLAAVEGEGVADD